MLTPLGSDDEESSGDGQSRASLSASTRGPRGALSKVEKKASFSGRPSVPAVPSGRREIPSATESSSKKKVQMIPHINPKNNYLLYD